ncbi:hypothetical protein SLEP1_g11288 [Rubroshorea leprosula]|uniref:U-box domain-containing protein n=1 Tax=Rubroshorea leprosula TaxID=152421 RepID=A0AAV5IKX6_9ROSI|nr:hypothetical protein SLEP1_g11288 [Rubroshorea leprosula]
MSSDEISLHNGLNVFQDDPFNCATARPVPGPAPGPKTRDLTAFIDDKLFSFPASQPTQFRPGNIYAAPPDRQPRRTWGNGAPHHSGDESDDDDDEEEDDDDDDGDDDDGDGDGEENNHNISVNSSSNNNNSAGESVHGVVPVNPDKIGNGKPKLHSSFVGGSREVAVKDGCNVGQVGRESNYQDTVTIAEPDGDIYYSHYLHAVDGSAAAAAGGGGGGGGGAGGGGGGGEQKDAVVDNGGGCGFSGRKEVSFSCESGESLRAILSDPVSGTLMDDAMILPCGHSFGAGGIQHVLRLKACFTCSQSVSEDQVAANLSLRAAIQAFRREEELQSYRSSKRRKERADQDKSSYGDSNLMDNPRGRGVQFPFAVMDRVIIKGNKRTPQRFVGREAVVTTQCLNGWYVVKTLDNAESVKLQYRSLAKVVDDPSSKPMSSKMAPSWL